ncbi:hypothetical protein ACSBR2_006665 [Camellia fascicularis]
MAVVLGNLALLLGVSSPRTVVLDRKPRPVPDDVILSLFKKDTHHHITGVNSFESGKESRRAREGEFEAVGLGEANEEESERDSGDERVGEEGGGVAKSDDEGDGKEETEEEKRMRVRKELEKVAKEQAERRKMAQLMFELGQRAYGKGMYGRAIEFLEGALTIIPSPTLYGGEIQIWLAMAYEANNRHADCIALYKQLERKHPSVSIWRQAAELRYILQAPKLKIFQEEMVTIPLIGPSYDR